MKAFILFLFVIISFRSRINSLAAKVSQGGILLKWTEPDTQVCCNFVCAKISKMCEDKK